MNRNNAIIIYNSVPYFKEKFIEKDIPCFKMYKDLPLFLKVFRKVSLKLNFFKSIWFDDWVYELDHIDAVIVFSTNPFETVDEIYKRNPKVQIVFWYWNPILTKGIKPFQISDEKCDKWSFDENDCKKFNLKQNTSFYFDNITLPINEIINDVVFLGVDKGRRNDLNSIEKEFISLGLKTKFHIVDDNWNDKNYTGDKTPISYEKYLEMLSRSKAILDFVQVGQSGLTLRPFESIFLNKKLITNDTELIKQDFYNPENVFILGYNSIENLKKFIDSPFIPVKEDIKNKYDVINWLDRFFK